MPDNILDCRGLSCPQPVINTKNALDGIEAGPLTIIVDNESSRTNVGRFLENQGLPVTVEEKGGEFHIRTAKGPETASAQDAPETAPSPAAGGKITVYVPSETMGRGDDVLGRSLMVTYLDTLSHFIQELDTILFVNSGIKLAVEGSPALESLKHLEQSGIRILSCGTCLNHFGLMEKLGVGEVTNMYSIIEAVSKSPKLMTP